MPTQIARLDACFTTMEPVGSTGNVVGGDSMVKHRRADGRGEVNSETTDGRYLSGWLRRRLFRGVVAWRVFGSPGCSARVVNGMIVPKRLKEWMNERQSRGIRQALQRRRVQSIEREQTGQPKTREAGRDCETGLAKGQQSVGDEMEP